MGPRRFDSVAHHRWSVLDRRLGGKRPGTFTNAGQSRDATARASQLWVPPASEEHARQMSTVELLSKPSVTAAPTWHAPASSTRPRRLRIVGAGLWLAIFDTSVVLGAFLAAYWVRFVLPADAAAALGLEQYLRMGLTIGSIACALLAMHAMYRVRHPRPWPARFNAIVSAVSTATVLSLVVSFYHGDAPFSRVWLATGWALAVVSLVAWRSLAQRLVVVAMRHAIAPARRVLIVGANGLGEELATELACQYEVVGYADNGSDLERPGNFPLLGTIAQLEQLVTSHAVDDLVIALPVNRREQVSRIIARGFRRHVTVKFLPGLHELLPQRFDVHDIGGRSYIGFAPVASVSWLKRASDLVLTSLALVALSPVLLAVIVAIKVDSPGPILYRQQRVGKDGRRFWMFKFRSMCTNADARLAELRALNQAIGPLFKIREDPRVTRVGRVIRRWSLDELPQLLNVLRGEMSLVGPRPPLPSEVEQYEDWQHGRLRAVPGLTGLWQVSGRSEVPFHDMVRLDLHYIRNWSLGLDLEILLRTIPAVVSNRGAY
jgi:exopolysaccharide biosynthesis polyprenyl glycosylphosphotransferase